jgi:hypothetical protein
MSDWTRAIIDPVLLQYCFTCDVSGLVPFESVKRPWDSLDALLSLKMVVDLESNWTTLPHCLQQMASNVCSIKAEKFREDYHNNETQ